MATSNRNQRGVIGRDTVRILDVGCYGETPIGEHLATMKAGTIVLDFTDGGDGGSHLWGESLSTTTTLELFRGTTLACCAALHRDDSKQRVAALNFASAKNPGGGVLTGASAQEESIARSTTLYASLTHAPVVEKFYSIHRLQPDNGFYSDRVIYSPGVLVFRDEATGDYLESPFVVDIFTSPAVNAGAVRSAYERKMLGDPEEAIRNRMRDRIRAVLRSISKQDYDAVVLGAFGCGVFKNDAAFVAKTFKEELSKMPTIRKPIFAIPDASTYETFKDAFEL